VFLSPPLGGLGVTYNDYLRLIGKCVVDFLIELLSLGVAAEALRVNIGSKSAISLQWGLVDPKVQVEWVSPPPTNHSSSQKTRLNVLLYGIKIWTDVSSVLSQSTCLTDGQTDRILIARSRLHSMQRGKNCRGNFPKFTTLMQLGTEMN